jgi:hypothetical protein
MHSVVSTSSGHNSELVVSKCALRLEEHKIKIAQRRIQIKIMPLFSGSFYLRIGHVFLPSSAEDSHERLPPSGNL